MYHGFGIHGYEHLESTFEGGQIRLRLRHKRASYRCSACRRWNVILHGEQERTFRTIPLGRKAVFLQVSIPRVECRACGVIRQVKLSFAEPRYGYTRAFERADWLKAEIDRGDASLVDYCCFLMLDFVTIDRDLGDVALSAAIVLARRLGIDKRFAELVQRELTLGKKAFAKIDKNAESILAKSETAQPT